MQTAKRYSNQMFTKHIIAEALVRRPVLFVLISCDVVSNFLQTVSKLVAGNVQQLGGLGLIAFGQFDGL